MLSDIYLLLIKHLFRIYNARILLLLITTVIFILKLFFLIFQFQNDVIIIAKRLKKLNVVLATIAINHPITAMEIAIN